MIVPTIDACCQGCNYTFMDDNATCHRTRAVIQWIQSKSEVNGGVATTKSRLKPDCTCVGHVRN